MPSGAGAAGTSIEIALPWGVWRRDRAERLLLPSSWTAIVCPMGGGAALSPEAIDTALDRPIGAEPLETLAEGARKVAIAIDDVTRPTPTALLLPGVLRRLQAAGVGSDRITIVIATGAHRRASREDVAIKVGSSASLSGLTVVSHDPAGDLVGTGQTLGGVPVRVNRAFFEADVRIGICGVIPHPFAGFSGGGKIVIPGLADLDVLARTHKFALMGLRGGQQLDGNRFRSDMEDVVRRIGLPWTVNVAINAQREPVAVEVGDLVEAHRAAARAAAAAGATTHPGTLLDAIILNAYPKDGELLQIETAFVALKSGMLRWLKPGAPIVLTAACLDGVGEHGLFAPGGRLFRAPAAKAFLADHPLMVFAPGVTRDACASVFWNGYSHFSVWADVVRALEAAIPPKARVGVVPCGPLQLAIEDTHAA